MQVTPVRVPVEPHVRTDEAAAAVDPGAAPAAVAPVARVSGPGEAQGGAAHERGRSGSDPHELRARDMAVRTEHALREPDGSLDLLPIYEYTLGPDGRPYAVDPYLAAAEASEDAPPVEAADVDEAAVPAEPAPGPAIAPQDRAPVDEPVDDHVARSYARLDEAEVPAKLDVIA